MSKINSATKRMLALFLAMLLIFSGVVVSASADGENQNTETTTTTTTTETTTVPAPAVPAPTLVSKSDTDRTATIKVPTLEGYTVQILVEPSASYSDLNNGNWLFLNLTPGQKYTFKAYVIFNNAPVYSTGKVEVTLKDKYPTPNAPVASKITATSITAVKVNNCEYKLVKADDQSLVKDWSDTLLFEGLDADTAYVLSIRRKGDNDKYASDPRSITIRTLKSGKAEAAGKPVLVDKTDKTIIVKCAESDAEKNIEFSIDKGKTWQHSGEFKNLTPNTIYGVIARETYDPAIQDPNPSSEILELKTNTRPRVEASLNKCTFKLDEGKVYANEYIGVTATGDGPADLYLAEYGDTKLVPSAVVVDGTSYPITNGKGKFIPGENNANKKITVNVVYEKHKYIGGGAWQLVGTVSSKQEVNVGPVKNILTTIAEFFTSIANFFLDTVPSLILGTGEYWEKGLALLFGMFGDLGITK